MELNPSDLKPKGETATLIGELKPVHPQLLDGRAGCETWSVEFSPDGSYFAWSLGHGIVKLLLWPIEQISDVGLQRSTACKNHICNAARKSHVNKEKTLDCGQTVWSLAFGPRLSKQAENQRDDAKAGPSSGLSSSLLLATGLNNGIIKVWEVKTGHLLFNLTEHRDVVRDLTFAPNGSLILVSGSRDKTLRIWDLTKDRKKAHVLTGHGNWVYSSCISPDCSIIASVCGHNQVYLWSLRSYTFIRYLEGKHCLISCDFSPDGALLITAAFSKELILWDPYTGEALRKLSHCFSPEYFPAPPDVSMRAVRFSPEGLYFASVAEDRAVRIWALGIDSPVMENCYTGVHVSNGLCCAFHPQGGVVATGTRDGYVQFWSTPRIVPSLRHLSRVSLRHSVSTYQVMALPIPNKMKDFLTYRTLARCHESSELHHLQDVVSLN
ncbi:WD repeat and SOCS box-containing protein 2 isoform X1 [Lepisosteus oculatus]|uniref:WD repeat and SOCS box-containing protein 2 isoform X1 n=1 Tax=Lepisosteus oculatus TaxID=7918 RepID=UPI0035F50578